MPEEQNTSFESAAEETQTEQEASDDFLSEFENDQEPAQPEQTADFEADAESEPKAQPEQAQNVQNEIIIDGQAYTAEHLKQLLNQPQIQYQLPPLIEEMARDAGMQPEEYLQAVEAQRKQRQIDTRVENLLDQGVPEDIALHLAKLEQDKALSDQEAFERFKQEQQQIAEIDARDNKMRAEITQFNRLYPNVTELPEAVIERIVKEGLTPTEAYQAQLLEEQNFKLNRQNQNWLNAQSTPGSARGQEDLSSDDFLSEFMKD